MFNQYNSYSNLSFRNLCECLSLFTQTVTEILISCQDIRGLSLNLDQIHKTRKHY